jgi:hypothetical protein
MVCRFRRGGVMLTEEALTIDWAMPAVRKALMRGRSNSGTITFHSADVELARIGFTWNATSRILELRYAIDGAPILQLIKVVETAPRLGGARSWFWCAFSNRRTRSLVLPRGAKRWVARAAAGLAYRSQCERSGVLRDLLAAMRRDRARLQRNAIRRLRRRERAAEHRT